MQQILFRIPITSEGIPIYGFGMMLFLAFLATTWLAWRRAQRVGIPKEFIQDLAIWIFVGGLLGARSTYLIFHERIFEGVSSLGEFFSALGEFLMRLPRIWDGGIILFGSVAGALAAYGVGYWLVFRKKGISTLKLADVLAPTIALGLVLGRLGCFLNGCCYGVVACPNCPAVSFPMSASPRFDYVVPSGYETAAGFLLDDSDEARVGHVMPGTAAQRSGLKSGDIIVSVNGRPLKDVVLLDVRDKPRKSASDAEKFSALLTSLWPRGREEMTLTVQRGGERVDLPAFQPHTLGLHPTQLYETISMVLLMLLLFAFEPFKRRDGQVMALMMIGYGIHRYLNELLRADVRPEGLESNTSVFLVIAGLGMMLWLCCKPAPQSTSPR